jgi:PAS domain S-box-containing protein
VTSSLDAWSLAALEALPVGVSIADARAEDTPLVFVNAAFRRLTGYEGREVLGKNCRFLQGPSPDPAARAQIRGALANGERVEITLQNYRKDGTPFRNHLILAPLHDASGVVTHYIGIQRDAEATEQAAARAKADAERLELLTRATHDAVWDWDLTTGNLERNEQFFELFGLDPNETWSLDAWKARLDPDQLAGVLHGLEAALADPEQLAYAHVYRFRGNDDAWHWVEDRSVILRDAEGKAYRAVGAIRDVTAKIAAEQQLRERAHRYLRLLDLAFEAVSVYDASGEHIYRNAKGDELAAMHGLQNGLVGLHADDVARGNAAMARLMREPGAQEQHTVRVRGRDDTYRWLEVRGENRVGDPDVRGIVLHWRDVTDERERERERYESAAREQRLRELFEIVEDVTQIGGWEIDVATGDARWTPGMHRIHETTPAILTPSMDTTLAFCAPGHKGAMERAIEQAKRDGSAFAVDIEILTARGRRVPVRVSGRAEMRDGVAVRIFGALQDVTIEVRARAALRRQATVIDQIRDAIVVLDLEGRVLSWNDGATRLYGQPIGAVLGRRRALFDPHATSMPPEVVSEALTRGQQLAFDARAQRGDQPLDLRVALTPFLDEQGARVGVIALVQDVTDTKRLRAQLEASQRMESVGLLAGGVAHDFNNLLTVVQGNADDMLESGGLPAPLRAQVLEVREAARRAASLTRQLLAFGRRQVLKPVRLELSALVSEVMQLLQRLVGEHIAIVRDPSTTLAWVEADRAQLEQVLLNLAINARDAMPAGGTLTLGVATVNLAPPTAEMPPGAYCALVVKDSGVGMDEATLARIFEPFFTTKDPSRGTGLGLATVYGIVKQSGGGVTVESAPGRGSTFRVLLPEATPLAAPVATEDPPAARPAAAGTRETILLVEDDDAVRRVCRRVLEKQGYAILEASRPSEALDIAAQRPTGIALVLTDIVMPGMSGAELVQRLRGTHPGIRYLLISGYADDMEQLRSAMDDGMTFLAKPFTPDQLARAVREALTKTDAGSRSP